MKPVRGNRRECLYTTAATVNATERFVAATHCNRINDKEVDDAARN